MCVLLMMKLHLNQATHAKYLIRLFLNNGAFLYVIATGWHIHAAITSVIIGSDSGLSPMCRQVSIVRNAGLLLIGTLGTNFNEILDRNSSIYIHKNPFEISPANREVWLSLQTIKYVKYLGHTIRTRVFGKYFRHYFLHILLLDLSKLQRNCMILKQIFIKSDHYLIN